MMHLAIGVSNPNSFETASLIGSFMGFIGSIISILWKVDLVVFSGMAFWLSRKKHSKI